MKLVSIKFLILSLLILPKIIHCDGVDDYDVHDFFYFTSKSVPSIGFKIDSFAPFGIKINERAPESIIPLLEESLAEGNELYKSFYTSKQSRQYDGEYIPKKNKYFNRVAIRTSAKPTYLVTSISASYEIKSDKKNGKYYDPTLEDFLFPEPSTIKSFVPIDSFISDTCIVIEKLCQKYGIPSYYEFENNKANRVYFVDNITYDSIFQRVSSFKNENLKKLLELMWTIDLNDDKGNTRLYIVFKLSLKPYDEILHPQRVVQRKLIYSYDEGDIEDGNIDDL
tara:strand:+ start:1318 stop:2160 length:843 start_codon:yes stop_codon:yes gene_type:complete